MFGRVHKLHEAYKVSGPSSVRKLPVALATRRVLFRPAPMFGALVLAPGAYRLVCAHICAAACFFWLQYSGGCLPPHPRPSFLACAAAAAVAAAAVVQASSPHSAQAVESSLTRFPAPRSLGLGFIRFIWGYKGFI